MPFYLNNGWLYIRTFVRPTYKLVYYINQKIDPAQWSKKKQRVLSTNPRADLINDMLRVVTDTIENTQLQFKIDGLILTPDKMRQILDQRLYGTTPIYDTPPTKVNLKEYCESFYQSRKGNIKDSTMRAYKSKMRRLFDKYPTLDFNDITTQWRYMAYNEMSNTWSHNNIAKIFSILRTILISAIDEGVTDIVIPKNMVPPSKDVDSIFLQKDIIYSLYNNKYLSETLTNAVRIWMLMYYTGQRVSDLRNVINGKITEYEGYKILQFRQQKTGSKVSIPVSEMMEELLTNPPRIISDQKINEYIKEAAKECGIPEFNKITNHTARRSCATNLALDGCPLHMIMNITGHKTEKELKKYIKYDDIQGAVNAAKSEFYANL